MDRNGMPDHIRNNHTRPAPGLDNPFFTTSIHLIDSFSQFRIHIGTFFRRSTQSNASFRLLSSLYNPLIGILVLSGFKAFG
jgi:hypothetical protein